MQDAPKARKKRVRDRNMTRRRILESAKKEFAAHGLAGARVDAIADRAKANKRMIYLYFGNKEDLFTAVVEDAYLAIREAERKLKLSDMEPEAAVDKLVRFTWSYYLKHPEFLTLVNSENLHKARHVKKLPSVREANRAFVDQVQSIIDRGVEKGVFREGIDAVNLNITIAAVGYYYLTNRFTGAHLFELDLMDPDMLAKRLEFNLATIRRLLLR